MKPNGVMEDEKVLELLNHDDSFRYQMLDRLRCDCEYFLGYGNRNPKILWAGSVKDQIEMMEAFWNSFPEEGKPEWLSWEQIKKYEKEMTIT